MPKSAISYNAILVLSALRQGARYGLEVIDATGLSSGTVYPALRRLESAGLIEASWEEEDAAREEGRPARRYYHVTREGVLACDRAVADLRARHAELGILPGSRG